jgi:hypothetical protein
VAPAKCSGALAALAIGLLLALLPSRACALTVAAMPLEQMTRTATLVVRARCIDRQVTRSADGRIESLARFQVSERAKGKAADVVTVRELGGRSGDTELVVPGAPLSEPGDDVVLFLEPHDGEVMGVVGLVLGYMPVATVPGSGATVRLSRTLGDIAANGVNHPVGELLDRVREIDAQQGGR